MNQENSNGSGNPNSNPKACASCKHQRKKCDGKCELAPYFPASTYREFQYAQKLFGVSNIQKMLNSVEPHQRQATAESILIEGTIRHIDPVHGCLGVVRRLYSQLEFYEMQIEDAKQHVAFFHENKKQQQLRKCLKSSSLSAFPPPFTVPLMVENNIFYGSNFQEPHRDLPDTSDHLNMNGGLYNYQSTMEEGGDMMQAVHQMTTEPYQTDQAFPCLDAPGEP